MKLKKEQITELELTEDTIVNLDNSMTSADIQALIDAQPKNLGGYTLTFQFADGTYTLGSTVTFISFYNGTVNIFGNITENHLVAHTNQAVIIGFTDTRGFFLTSNLAIFNIRNIKFSMTLTTWHEAIISYLSTGLISIDGNYFICDTVNGVGIAAAFCPSVYASYNYFTKLDMGIGLFQVAHLHSKENISHTTNLSRGLSSSNGSVISKEGTQPAATTAESSSYGGVIR